MWSAALKGSFLFCVLFLPVFADAATLRVVPARISAVAGETVAVTIAVTSSDQAMNATEGVLKFPTDLLQVASVSKGGSVLGLWVQEPSFSNSAGTVNFEGVALNPGYTGSNGTVLTVTFRVRAEGSANLSIVGASVLANDGSGTEILTGTQGGVVSIGPALERAAPTPIPAPATTPVPRPTQMTPVPPPSMSEMVQTMPEAPKTTIERPIGYAFIMSLKNSTWLLGILILLFVLLDLLLLGEYFRLRRREGGEFEHAQVVAHRSFLLLRDDIDTYVKALESASGRRKLTPIEARFVKEMSGDLSVAEKAIVKEMREAEKRKR